MCLIASLIELWLCCSLLFCWFDWGSSNIISDVLGVALEMGDC